MSATFEFEDFEFIEQDDDVRVNFLKQFYFNIRKEDLNSISEFKLDNNIITFTDTSEKSASNKFNKLLAEGFHNLRNTLNNHPTIYIHQNSGIPIIGNRIFGIIDRGTDMIELKPLTSCNINCIYCSVDEGTSSKKITDFVVENDYLVDETKKLLKIKEPAMMKIYINPHGEPLLYKDITRLVKDLKEINNIDEIHIITNGLLLNKQLIDNLEKAGLTHMNISISSLDEKNAKILAGTAKYNIKHIKDMIIYAKDKFKIIITPVFVPTKNKSDMDDIIKFAKPMNIEVMIQNFLENKRGRNPVKCMPWDDFYSFLTELENRNKIMLIKSTEDIEMKKTTELDCPFKREERTKVEIIAPGRYPNESIGIAKDRAILVLNHTFESHKTIKTTIIKVKHNLITARA